MDKLKMGQRRKRSLNYYTGKGGSCEICFGNNKRSLYTS